MIKLTFRTLIDYFKNPNRFQENDSNFKEQFLLFGRILAVCVIVAVLSTPIFTLLDEFGVVNMDSHKVEELFKQMSPFQIILIGGFLVPLIEELLFRAPMTLFKKPKSFKIAFWVLTIVFGFIHISNFELSLSIILLSPILVIPQLFAGIALGYIRVKQGLLWSIALHSVYNSIFLIISILTDMI